MSPILLLLLFPLGVAVFMRVWRGRTYSWSEMGVQVVLTLVLIVGGYQGGKSLSMQSVEFWTGSITAKHEVDGHYTEPYDCNCTRDKDGNESCQTCYEDHYTRHWYFDTTIGRIDTSHVDYTSRSRRNRATPDQHWTDGFVGEACSKTNTYTNYVSAAENSLHHRSGKDEHYTKMGVLIDYPQLHGIYHLKRAIPVGVGVPEMDKWLLGLDGYMKNLGGLKQINIFVVFVPDTLGEGYVDALEAHWRGANKNDTVIVLGIDKQTKDIGWVDTITWAKSNIYALTLRDEIIASGNVREAGKADEILATINEVTLKHYERRPMAEFEHLKDEIKPPTWMMVILILIAIPGSLVLAFIFDRIDLDEIIRRSTRGRRRRYYR